MLVLVLADLPLPFQPLDLQLEADDAPGDGGDEVFGSVGYAPRSGPRGLVGVREGVEVSEEPFRIFDYAKRTVSVDDGVVPGWGRPCRSRPSPDTSSA